MKVNSYEKLKLHRTISVLLWNTEILHYIANHDSSFYQKFLPLK